MRRSADAGVGDQVDRSGEGDVGAGINGLQGTVAVAVAVQIDRLVDRAGQSAAGAEDGSGGHDGLSGGRAQGVDVADLQVARVDVGLAAVGVVGLEDQAERCRFWSSPERRK